MNAFSAFYTFLQNFQDPKEAGSNRFSLNNRLPTASHVPGLPLITKEPPVSPVDKQPSTYYQQNSGTSQKMICLLEISKVNESGT